MIVSWFFCASPHPSLSSLWIQIPLVSGDMVNSLPSDEVVDRFVSTVHHYRTQSHAPGEPGPGLVLVHGSLGYNRTGYMMLHYILRTQPGVPLEQVRMNLILCAAIPGIPLHASLWYIMHCVHDAALHVARSSQGCPPTLFSGSDWTGDMGDKSRTSHPSRT